MRSERRHNRRRIVRLWDCQSRTAGIGNGAGCRNSDKIVCLADCSSRNSRNPTCSPCIGNWYHKLPPAVSHMERNCGDVKAFRASLRRNAGRLRQLFPACGKVRKFPEKNLRQLENDRWVTNGPYFVTDSRIYQSQNQPERVGRNRPFSGGRRSSNPCAGLNIRTPLIRFSVEMSEVAGVTSQQIAGSAMSRSQRDRLVFRVERVWLRGAEAGLMVGVKQIR